MRKGKADEPTSHGRRSIKLARWYHVVLFTAAAFIGAGVSLYLRFRREGYLRPNDFVMAAVMALLGTAMVGWIAWYANKPERGE